MTFWVGTSFKMNKTLGEALAYADGLARSEQIYEGRLQPFIIPPFTAVREVKRALAATPVKVGAQNMHWADEGAWTGEISALMLKDCGLDLVEIGHSERRAHFGETDETVGLKVAAALRHNLIALICIGETAAERDAGLSDDILQRQVEAAFASISSVREDSILLAYEPVWAIGAGGVPASADYANARHAAIAHTAKKILGGKVPVLYGGSVSEQNCAELIKQPHIDGLFIGRAAWNVEGYLNILAQVGDAI